MVGRRGKGETSIQSQSRLLHSNRRESHPIWSTVMETLNAEQILSSRTLCPNLMAFMLTSQQVENE